MSSNASNIHTILCSDNHSRQFFTVSLTVFFTVQSDQIIPKTDSCNLLQRLYAGKCHNVIAAGLKVQEMSAQRLGYLISSGWVQRVHCLRGGDERNTGNTDLETCACEQVSHEDWNQIRLWLVG